MEARPNYGWLAEESAEIKGADPTRRWIVDPLDGTTNFLHGLPHWAVSIALEHKGEIVAGVIYDPIKDEMFVAEKGAGAWVNDRRLRVSGRRDLSAMLFGTGVPFASNPNLPQSLREIAALTPQTAGIRRWGAAALDLAYVAAGRLDGFWERGDSSMGHGRWHCAHSRGRRFRRTARRGRGHIRDRRHRGGERQRLRGAYPDAQIRVISAFPALSGPSARSKRRYARPRSPATE